VLWYQTKHGLPRTGRVDARSVATLRQTARAGRAPVTGEAASPPSAAQEARAFARTSPPATLERADRTWLMLLALMTMLGLAAIAWWLRAELRARPARPADVRDGEPRARLTAVTPPPAHAPVDVVGYVALARGSDRDRELDTGAQIVGSWCEGRGWQLTQLVHDIEPASGRITDRPGLAYALEQIAAGRVAGLVLAHLGDLTRSVTELAQLLQWLNQAEAFMIALDYELDTSTAAGELAAGALIQIGDWERSRIADRTRPGLTAMQPGGASNHASVRDDPELSARLSAMRAQGMSLQAISDTLNAEAVPTPRGGTHWRPSSVQAATGYKRPSAKPAGGLELPPLARTNATNTRQRCDNEPT
jgi:DNA invertase Pin-like site-specific DNA recombinase